MDRGELPPDQQVNREAGTAVHEVFEHFYTLYPQDRTPEALAEILDIILEQSSFAPLLDDRSEFDQIVKTGVGGLFSIEKPTEVQVFENELELNCEVLGVPLRAFIDRIDERGDGGDLIIIDYKNGKPKHASRFVDDYHEQIRFYAAGAYVMTGRQIAAGVLAHPSYKENVPVDVSPEAVYSTMVQYAQIWKRMKLASANFKTGDRDSFDANTGILCGWCDYAPICPSGTEWLTSSDGQKAHRKWSSKPQNAGKVMPQMEALGTPVQIVPAPPRDEK